MSTLDSSSTLAEIRAAIADNASYEEDASAAKARAFITAGRLYLFKVPRRAVHGGQGAEEIDLAIDVLQQQLEEARRWLASKTAVGSGIVHPSFANLR